MGTANLLGKIIMEQWDIIIASRSVAAAIFCTGAMITFLLVKAFYNREISILKGTIKSIKEKNHKSKKKLKPTVNIKKKLEKDREHILLNVSVHPELEDNELAKKLSIGADTIMFHLEELRISKLVKVEHILSSAWKNTPYRKEWSIDHLGRKYLIHHKLIK